MKREEAAKSIYAAGLKSVATTPEPKNQKFHCGDFVMVAKDLGSCMRHFESGVPARVEYTYAHAYGGNDIDSYSLLLKYPDGEWSTVAWYHEHQLTLITEENLIEEFKNEIKLGNFG